MRIGTLSSTVTSSFANAGFESISTINGSGVQLIKFMNIPQNYTDLLILYSSATVGRTTQEGYPTIRYNNDSGNNYSRLSFNMANTMNSQINTAGQDFVSAGGSFATDSPRAIPGSWYIFDYSSTDKRKNSRVFLPRNFSNASFLIESLTYLWNNTSAINEISLTADLAGGFTNYSQFSLYGIGKK
jgi:hypothetical protein